MTIYNFEALLEAMTTKAMTYRAISQGFCVDLGLAPVFAGALIRGIV